jgi:hypothetical protein
MDWAGYQALGETDGAGRLAPIQNPTNRDIIRQHADHNLAVGQVGTICRGVEPEYPKFVYLLGTTYYPSTPRPAAARFAAVTVPILPSPTNPLRLSIGVSVL